tara:strand:- start:1057 stop:1557 length:501 start_codon:yes stop_codon:yes gene_type:complete
MAITINNVTANNQITIIFDAGIDPNNTNNGPREYSGETQADVIIDGVGYHNISSADIIPTNIHAFQYKPATNTGHIEYVGADDNLAIADANGIPAWANTMITRWNGEKTYAETWSSTFETEYAAQIAAFTANTNPMTDEAYTSADTNAQTAANTAATTAKNNILGA